MAPHTVSSSTDKQHAVSALLGSIPHVHWYRQTAKTLESCYQHAHLFGYLNPLRATPIQIVDQAAMEWMFSMSDSELRQSPCFDAAKCVATIMCDSLKPNPNIEEICVQHDIALLKTSLNPGTTLDYLQGRLPQMLSPRCNKHGVFLAVMNTGVMITGVSGVGKSEVALDLIQRGHQLIADDIVDIYRRDGAELFGECSPTLKGYLEIRGLGIINIEKMFGPAAVLDHYQLQLIINLKDATNTEIRNLDRLQPSLEDTEILGRHVPTLNMLVAPGRNLSVLVEAATRDHLLRMSGVDSSLEFIHQHDKMMGVEALSKTATDEESAQGKMDQ
ncbi:MAG: HPr(Ser) kinase/phosphatase [Acidiferrobacterales bacterium]|nr:HPr(Ser) kinase/phosphatase [Acidiferrobacterales bacterium]